MKKRVHQLKANPETFHQIVTGERTFDVRRNDRKFEPGDAITFWEFTRPTSTGRVTLTGKTSMQVILNVLHASKDGAGEGLRRGWVALTLKNKAGDNTRFHTAEAGRVVEHGHCPLHAAPAVSCECSK